MKYKIKPIFIRIFCFTTMFLVAIGGGYYKKSLADETAKFKSLINADTVIECSVTGKPVLIDINKQGLPKKLFQPTRLSVSGTITNTGKESVLIELVSKGFTDKVSLSSTNNHFNSRTGKYQDKIEPNKSVNLSMLIDLAKEDIKKHEVNAGLIKITNLKDNKIIGVIPFKIINSAIPGVDSDDSLKQIEEESCK